MTTPRMSRLAAGALIASSLALGACETSHSDIVGPDSVPPTVTLTLDPATDSVDVGSPVQLLLDARDNLSLKHLTVLMNGEIVFDTTFTSATPRFTQPVPVQITGVLSGTTLQFSASTSDGADNAASSTSFSVIAYNSSAPVVTVTAPATGTAYRAGDPATITVSATDPTGITRIGYQIVQVDSVGNTTVLQEDSVDVTGAPTTYVRTFNTTILASIPPGSYDVRGFARNAALNGAITPQQVGITVRDAIRPGLDVLSPPADSNVTVGATLRVRLHLTDNVGVSRVSVVGVSTRGDPDLGPVDTTTRYDSAFAPVNVNGQPQSFPTATRDTIVTRLMTPAISGDSITGPLYLIARVTDVAGNDSLLVRRIQMVSGPSVIVVRPGAGAVAAPGKSLVVELRGVDRDGVRVLGYNVTGAFTATRTAPAPSQLNDTLVFVDTLLVPAGATAPGSFTITPFATDNLGQPGSGGSVVVSVQSLATDNVGPLVYQSLGTRVESDDSISIRAVDPSGIQYVGLIMRSESSGATLDSVQTVVGGAFTDVTVPIPLNVPSSFVGQKIVLVAFAADARGNVGFSIPSSNSTAQAVESAARPDTALVVYGRTFAFPAGGTGADIAVDTIRGRAYISNLTFSRLEVWNASSGSFSSAPIAVGSQPWGMAIDNSGDTLLVANSGGTNISRVALAASPAFEVSSRRIKTTNNFVADVLVTLDPESGIAHFKVDIFDYSDRPQYIAQARSGDIYFSTKPTFSAPEGTIRRYDPTTPQPESQQLWQYGVFTNAAHVAIINADSILLQTGLTASVSDSLYICDRPYGMSDADARCFKGVEPFAIVAAMNSFFITNFGQPSDVALVSNLDVKSLGLEDTTFVAVSGDRRLVAFGEGNSGQKAGRIMTIQDTTSAGCSRACGGFFSPSLSVADLVDNASEHVFGIALNRNGSAAAAHGGQSYFFETAVPLQLRLQGHVNTFDQGAGIAFHPDNTEPGIPSADPNDPTRVAFVASSNGTIEIVDSFHYINRGTLPVRANLYGPIRVTRRFPTDPPDVVAKIFGLTTEGLVVIDVRSSDIKPVQ